ncbi:hypothetical protein F1880_009014 [Penicillium rolfsii]|nr:hypothetical protein F1880_009014 [Penicillium rolfsii]
MSGRAGDPSEVVPEPLGTKNPTNDACSLGCRDPLSIAHRWTSRVPLKADEENIPSSHAYYHS